MLVDVLSFTTAVELAVARGARVYPYRVRDHTATTFAMQLDAELAVDRRQVSPENPYSLSPRSLTALPPGSRLVLPSLNGATLTLFAAESQRMVLAGCLRNASAVAAAAQRSGGPVAVIAAGELRRDGALRFAVEDLIGAGAILRHFERDARSPEADAAVAAFEDACFDLERRLRHSGSGRELEAMGADDDVVLAAEVDVSQTVPVFQEGAYARLAD